MATTSYKSYETINFTLYLRNLYIPPPPPPANAAYMQTYITSTYYYSLAIS